MKYVIGYQDSSQFILPIVFPEEVVHFDMKAVLPMGTRIISAGFCEPDPTARKVMTHGKSESLGLEPTPADAKILRAFLFEGLSGLKLSNAIAVTGLQKP